MSVIIKTSEFRQDLAEIFAKVESGTDVILVFGHGKKARKIRLTSSGTTPKKAKKDNQLSKNHSLMKFANSKFYQELKPNQLPKIKDLKAYHQKNFLKDSFESRYN